MAQDFSVGILTPENQGNQTAHFFSSMATVSSNNVNVNHIKIRIYLYWENRGRQNRETDIILLTQQETNVMSQMDKSIAV